MQVVDLIPSRRMAVYV